MEALSKTASAPRCLLCGGAGTNPAFPYDTMWNGRRFEFRACSRCGSSFIDPVPSDAEFAAMYAGSAYHAEFYGELCEEAAETSLLEVSSLLPARARILDFGCGNGSFLTAARHAGFAGEGVELDEGTIGQAARNSGCEIFSFGALHASGRRYDVVHLGDVLEHLPRPAATMRELEDVLKPAGLFFLEGPLEDNASPVFYASKLFGRVKRLLRPATHGSFVPFHLFRTTARAQRDFFEQVLGYEVLYYAVYESGWPYGAEGSLAKAGSLGAMLRRAIGKSAVAAARTGWGKRLQLGNRFTAVLRPRPA